MSEYENILVEQRGRVGIITLNRPTALNALNAATMHELVAAARNFDADEGVGCIVLTGSERAFAAGADIKEMAPQSAIEMYRADWFADWDGFTSVRTPVIAAVAGYALGGGCEVAMMCDFIIAADTAKFGQPEINLGILPGMGGTQRLVRSIGKSKAMEMCLTGRMMDAAEAERAGLVAKVVPAAELLDSAVETASVIAEKSLVAALMVKESINNAYELSLKEGLHAERRLFHTVFASEDQKEGMDAFVTKRKAEFRHR